MYIVSSEGFWKSIICILETSAHLGTASSRVTKQYDNSEGGDNESSSLLTIVA